MTGTPVVDSIQPDSVASGDLVSLSGYNFGRKEKGKLFLGNKALSSSAVKYWTENRIDFEVPVNQRSVLVFVETKNMRSKGMLLTMEQELPGLVSSSYLPGYPYLENGETINTYGKLLSLRGENMSFEKGTVFWSVNEIKPGDDQNSLMALPDSCIVKWENRQIKLLLPIMEGEGFLYIKKGNLLSNGVPVEIIASINFTRNNKQSVKVEWNERIDGFSAFGKNSLALWYPLPPVTMNQKILSHKLNSLVLSQYNPETAYRGIVQNLRSGDIAERHLVSLIELSRTEFKYKEDLGGSVIPDESAYESYKASTLRIPSGAKSIVSAVSGIVAKEKRPLVRAWKLYNYTLARLRYRLNGETTVLKAQSGRKADSSVYALHYITLLRAAGIPAREISGLLLLSDGLIREHNWVEFFIPDLGWLSADPWMGDKFKPDSWYKTLSPALYFGGLDEYHLALFREGDAPDEFWWNSRKMRGAYNFQPLEWTTESKGNIYRWESRLEGPEVTFETNRSAQ